MQTEAFIHQEFNKQFAYLKQLYENLPLSEKEKSKWVELRRGKKILSLIALHNPGLRDSLQQYTINTNREETIPVSRESQTFETLLGNLNNFINQNKHSDFVEFLNLGKRSSVATTLNLFSIANEEQCNTQLGTDDVTFIQEIENKTKEPIVIADKIWLSFLVFKQLIANKTGINKYGCLFAEFILKNEEKNLLNFPLLVWESFNKVKSSKEKSFAGKRFGSISFNDITQDIFLETAVRLIEGNIHNLLNYFRTKIKIESQDVESKIRINFLIDRAFQLPEKIYQNGFSKTHHLLKTLCMNGGLRKEDVKSEGGLLLAELLESESFLVQTQNTKMEWVVNVSYGAKPCRFSQFNNIDIMIQKGQERDVEFSDKEGLNLTELAFESSRL